MSAAVREPENTPTTPSSGATEGTGLELDEILKAPVTPPKPIPGDHGPDIARKIDDISHEKSAQLGPDRPAGVNKILVGVGIVIVALGMVCFVLGEFGLGSVILFSGFIAVTIGSFVRF